MLVVQRIRTIWSKRSRGGDLARVRNSTPDGLYVPPFDTHVDYVLHDIRFSEYEDFRQFESVEETTIGGPSLIVEPLGIRVTSQRAEVEFHWSWNHCGAPQRSSHAIFELGPGQWGRFTCNGRFGATTMRGSEWTYQTTVMNVAFADSIDPSIFVGTRPNRTDARMAALR